MPTTTQRTKQLAQRLARAQAKADELRAEVELAAVAMRAEGATLEEIGTILGISRMGVLKMMRRHEQ
jgi:DNA-binding CsgD family transcriptional regulator